MLNFIKRIFGQNGGKDDQQTNMRQVGCVCEEKWNAAVLDLQGDQDKTVNFIIKGGRKLFATKFISGDKNTITWESRSGEHTTSRRGVIDLEVVDRKYIGTISKWCGDYGFLTSDDGRDFHFYANKVNRSLLAELATNYVGQRVIFHVWRKGRLGKLASVVVDELLRDGSCQTSVKVSPARFRNEKREQADSEVQVNIDDTGTGKVTAWYRDRAYGFVQDGATPSQYFFIDGQSAEEDMLARQLSEGMIGQRVEYRVIAVSNGKYPKVRIRFSKERAVLPTGDSEYESAKKAALLGRVSTAISIYQDLLRNPNNEDFLSAVKDLAEIYNRTDPDRAVTHIEKFRPLVPLDVRRQLDRMKLIYLLHGNRHDEARALAEKLLQDTDAPPNRILHYKRVVARIDSLAFSFKPIELSPFEQRIGERYEQCHGNVKKPMDQVIDELKGKERRLRGDVKSRGGLPDGYVDEAYNSQMMKLLYEQIVLLQKEDESDTPLTRNRLLKKDLRQYFFRKSMALLGTGDFAAAIAYMVMMLRHSDRMSNNEKLVRLVVLGYIYGRRGDQLLQMCSWPLPDIEQALKTFYSALSPEMRLSLGDIAISYDLLYLFPELMKDADAQNRIRSLVDEFQAKSPERLSEAWLDGARDILQRLLEVQNPLEAVSVRSEFNMMLDIVSEFIRYIDYPTRKNKFTEFEREYIGFVKNHIDDDRGLTLFAADVYYPILKKIHQTMDQWLAAILDGQLSFELTHADGSDYLPIEDEGGGHDMSVRLAFKLKSINRTAPTITSIRLRVAVASAIERSPGEDIFASDECSLCGGEEIEVGGRFKVPPDVYSDPECACDLLVTMEYRTEHSTRERQQVFKTIMTVISERHEWQEIPNPYRLWAGGKSCSGAHSEECFVGRQELLSEMESTFGKTEGGQCYVLYGQRRIGKTSLYDNLRGRLGNRRYVYVQIPAQTKFDFGTDYRVDFANAIANDDDVKMLVAEAGGGIPNSTQEPIRAVEAICRAAHAMDKVLVIGIDEFTTIYEDYVDLARGRSNEPDVRQRIEKFIAMLKQNLDAGMYHLLLLGRPSMEQFKDDFGVELCAMDNMRTFWGLDTEAVKKLVYDKLVTSAGSSRFRGKAYQCLCELLGGSPYLIHKFCSCLVDYLNKNRYPIIGEAQIESVLDMLCKQGARHLSLGEFKQWYVFKDLSVSDAAVLDFEVRTAQKTQGGYALERADLLNAGGADEKAFELARRWRVLEQVQGTEKFKFAVGLYERWLCENKSLVQR